jgi:hypothetical protein
MTHNACPEEAKEALPLVAVELVTIQTGIFVSVVVALMQPVIVALASKFLVVPVVVSLGH